MNVIILTYWTIACLIGYAFCVSDPVITASASHEITYLKQYEGKCKKCHEYQKVVMNIKSPVKGKP